MPCYEKLIDSRIHGEKAFDKPKRPGREALSEVEDANHLGETRGTLHRVDKGIVRSVPHLSTHTRLNKSGWATEKKKEHVRIRTKS